MNLKEETQAFLVALLNFPKSLSSYFSSLLPSFLPVSNPAPQSSHLANCFASGHWDNRSNQKRPHSCRNKSLSSLTHLEVCPSWFAVYYPQSCQGSSSNLTELTSQWLCFLYCFCVVYHQFLPLGRIIFISILTVLYSNIKSHIFKTKQNKTPLPH